MKNIGILDSGVGGLSILGTILEQCRGLRCHYLADTAFFPYGKMSDDQVGERVVNLADEFITRLELDLLIVACNTASTIALDRLRARCNALIVGVVPAIKPAAAVSRSGSIGILATERTVNGPYLLDLIKEFAPNKQVTRLGCPDLVEIAETKLRGGRVDQNILRDILDDMYVRDPKIDTVVLGCTHFPLVVDELKQVSAACVTWLDSGMAIAKRVSQLVPELTMDCVFVEFYVTGPSEGDSTLRTTLSETYRLTGDILRFDL